MKATDLCAIIEAAGKAGVRHLRVGDVEISFEETTPDVAGWNAKPAQEQKPELTEEQKRELAELRRAEAEAQLALLDPVAHMTMLERGESLENN